MAKTDAELLDLVDAAIESVLTKGQAVGAMGQTWTKADLTQLYKMRADLQARVAAAKGSPLRRAVAAAPYRG
ncbi:MAG TPA: peptidylprolyl isomerase [Acidobacteria bacterium]|nr:peptidylprolyl isomerase [Acidobacteriota bacterium]